MNKRKIMSSVVKSTNGVTYTPSLVTLEDGEDINSVHLLDTDILSGLSILQILNSGDADTLWQSGGGLESINRKITEEKYQSTVTGDYAVNLGLGSNVSGKGSVNIGYNNNVGTSYSIVAGQLLSTSSNANFSATFGVQNKNSGQASLIFGNNNTNSGTSSIIGGGYGLVIGKNCLSITRGTYLTGLKFEKLDELKYKISNSESSIDIYNIKIYLSDNHENIIYCRVNLSDDSLCDATILKIDNDYILSIVGDNFIEPTPQDNIYKFDLFFNCTSGNTTVSIGNVISNSSDGSVCTNKAVCNGDYSICFGQSTMTGGENSMILGDFSISSGNSNVIFGGAHVYSNSTFAFGMNGYNIVLYLIGGLKNTKTYTVKIQSEELFNITHDIDKILVPGVILRCLNNNEFITAKIVNTEIINKGTINEDIQITTDVSLNPNSDMSGKQIKVSLGQITLPNLGSNDLFPKMLIGQFVAALSKNGPQIVNGYASTSNGPALLVSGYGLYSGDTTGESAFGILNYPTIGSGKTFADASLFTIGCGLLNDNSDPDTYNRNVLRRNALEVKRNGDIYVFGVGNYDGKRHNDAESLQNVLSILKGTIVWDNASNMNNYKDAGLYTISGIRSNSGDNMPISNYNTNGYVSGTLIINKTTADSETGEYIISQNLTLANKVGGETKQYIRSCIVKGDVETWTPWKESNMIQLFGEKASGLASDADINAAIDNGQYMGVYTGNTLMPTGSTFTMTVINNYAANTQTGQLNNRQVTQIFFYTPLSTNGQINPSNIVKRDGIGDGSITWGDIEQFGSSNSSNDYIFNISEAGDGLNWGNYINTNDLWNEVFGAYNDGKSFYANVNNFSRIIPLHVSAVGVSGSLPNGTIYIDYFYLGSQYQLKSQVPYGNSPTTTVTKSRVGLVDTNSDGTGEIFNSYGGNLINKATGKCSHAEGLGTTAVNNGSHAEGTYNVCHSGSETSQNTIHAVGIGTSRSDNKNAHEIMSNGDHYIYGIGNYNGIDYESAKTLQEVVNSIQTQIGNIDTILDNIIGG